MKTNQVNTNPSINLILEQIASANQASDPINYARHVLRAIDTGVAPGDIPNLNYSLYLEGLKGTSRLAKSIFGGRNAR